MKFFEGLRDDYDRQRIANAALNGAQVEVGIYNAYTARIEEEKLRNHKALVRRMLKVAKSPKLVQLRDQRFLSHDDSVGSFGSPWIGVGRYEEANMEARLVRWDKLDRGGVVEIGFTTAYVDIDLRITDGAITKEQSPALRFDTTDNMVKLSAGNSSFEAVDYGSEGWGEVLRLASIIDYNVQTSGTVLAAS